jgi:hypothetical protein
MCSASTALLMAAVITLINCFHSHTPGGTFDAQAALLCSLGMRQNILGAEGLDQQMDAVVTIHKEVCIHCCSLDLGY